MTLVVTPNSTLYGQIKARGETQKSATSVLRSCGVFVQERLTSSLPPSPTFLSLSSGVERIVKLTRGAQGYGIAICGASDAETMDEVRPRGVYISCINKHSPAARDGRLCVGDQIVKINGADLREATIPEALTLIERAASEAEFVAVNNEAGFAPFRKTAREMQVCQDVFGISPP